MPRSPSRSCNVQLRRRPAWTKRERRRPDLRGRMIALQEELDWQCYHLYGLLTEDLRYTGDDLPELALGQRAFEIVMARQMAKGELVKPPGSSGTARRPSPNSPATGPRPTASWSSGASGSSRRTRKSASSSGRNTSAAGMTSRGTTSSNAPCESWLLDRLESPRYWPDARQHAPALQSTAQLADKASGDHDFLQVAALYRGRPDFQVAALVAELVEGESVPFLPVLRYKPSGLRKRRGLGTDLGLSSGRRTPGRTWAKSRCRRSTPRPTSSNRTYWRLRGKLDVPKERWISYPHLQTESDPSLVVGWAGWDHLQQATALSPTTRPASARAGTPGG